MSSEAAAIHFLVDYVYIQRHIVDYFYILAFAVVIYDYLLTLYHEVVFVWFSPWNYTKLLFLLARYLPLVTIYFGVYTQLVIGSTVASCRWHIQAFVWLLTVTIVFSDTILTVRTWAVWRRSKKVGIALGTMLGVSTGVTIGCNVSFVNSIQLQPTPYPAFRGCNVTGTNNILVVDWAMLCVVDIIVLSLMTISAYKAYKQGDKNRFSDVVHRDGIVFYIVLLGITFASLICMAVLVSELGILLIPLQTALYSIFSCRIILNIRSVDKRRILVSQPTALHDDSSDEFGDLTFFPMVFRPNTTAMSLPDVDG